MITLKNNIFGIPMQRVKSVFVPRSGDSDTFLKMMRLKAQGDAQHMAREAKKQKARAKLPQQVRDYYERFEARLHTRIEKNNSYFGGIRS